MGWDWKDIFVTGAKKKKVESNFLEEELNHTLAELKKHQLTNLKQAALLNQQYPSSYTGSVYSSHYNVGASQASGLSFNPEPLIKMTEAETKKKMLTDLLRSKLPNES